MRPLCNKSTPVSDQSLILNQALGYGEIRAGGPSGMALYPLGYGPQSV